MKKFVNDLKVSWPAFLAIAVAISLVSYHNDKVREENEKRIIENNIVTFEETFKKSNFVIEEVELEELIKPEETEKEAGFSK